MGSEASIEQAFAAAREAHGAGRLDDAARLYQAVLDQERRHAGALQALGLLHAQLGRFGEAIKLLRRAVEQAPRSAQTHNDLGAALQAVDRLDEAIARYRRALTLAPSHAGAHYNLGSALHRQGRLADALPHYEAAVAHAPDLAEAHANLGTALAALGRPADAIEPLRRSVALKPDALEAHNLLGSLLQGLGRFDEACAAFATAASANPDVAVFHSNLGGVLGLLGRDAHAMQAFERAIALAPELADAHDNLGILMQRQARHEAAIMCFERAIAAQPGHASAHNNLGISLQALGRHDQAVPRFEAALALHPDYAEAHNNLGNALMALDRPEAAIARYETALRIRPGFAQPHYNLGNALVAIGRPAEAIDRYRSALALRPAYAAAHNHLGSVLAALGRESEAVASCEQALGLDPTLASAYARLAGTLGALGRFTEARAHIATAIALAPDDVMLHVSHGALKRYSPGDPDLARLEAFLPTAATLPEDHRIALHFALAKAYDEVGDPARAFDHLLTGNALKRRLVEYDEAEVLARFARIPALVTPAVIGRHRGAGEPSPLPIFIVGMPRSGTTLIEQILASHPSVFGAGELMTFPEVVDRHVTATRAPAFPELMTTVNGATLRQIGADYVAAVRGLAPAAARLVDKLPGNFIDAGLVHLALPGARIIHAQRNPVDTCVSCFSILFEKGQPFTYELGELGRYYRAHATLMAHWRRVLPPEVLLDVRYEDVVEDLEGQARRIIAHCGLPWSDACLAFHATERTVRTASALQVRQPIYRASVGRWRRFGDRLAPLLAALGPDGAAG